MEKKSKQIYTGRTLLPRPACRVSGCLEMNVSKMRVAPGVFGLPCSIQSHPTLQLPLLPIVPSLERLGFSCLPCLVFLCWEEWAVGGVEGPLGETLKALAGRVSYRCLTDAKKVSGQTKCENVQNGDLKPIAL